MLHIVCPSGGVSDHLNGALKLAPAIPFTVTCKVADYGAVPAGNLPMAGLVVCDGGVAPGKLVHIGVASVNGQAWALNASDWTSPTVFSANIGAHGQPAVAGPLYFRLIVHTAANIDGAYSYGGRSWTECFTGLNFLVAATGVGMVVNANASEAEAFWDWIRFA